MRDYSGLLEIAKNNECKYIIGAKMSDYTTFKIGGPVDVLLNVENLKGLSNILKFCYENKINTYIIGNGSNLLVSDDGLNCVCIKLCGDFFNIRLNKDKTITCGTGVSLAKLCKFAAQNSLSGLEFAWGIPGSVGGAAFMNAGAYSGEMKDVIKYCEHVTNKGEIGRFNKNELDFSYRKSAYSDKNYVITSVTFELAEDDGININSQMNDYLDRRKAKQPLNKPSAGSVFKRPAGNYAGSLIQECGLKGKKIGGASVSDKHSGFIVNLGGATYKDVKLLIELIKNTVKNEKGIELECEIKDLNNSIFE